MVSFRRGITALGMFALFTGLAAAQVGQTGQSQLTCNTNVTVTPALRGEGFTEQTGDITISCTGGAPLAPGASIPLVNIAVFYNTTVTSRLLPTTTNQTSNQTSEALLLIDEPGSGLPGYGPSLPQVLCTTPLWFGLATTRPLRRTVRVFVSTVAVRVRICSSRCVGLGTKMLPSGRREGELPVLALRSGP